MTKLLFILPLIFSFFVSAPAHAQSSEYEALWATAGISGMPLAGSHYIIYEQTDYNTLNIAQSTAPFEFWNVPDHAIYMTSPYAVSYAQFSIDTHEYQYSANDESFSVPIAGISNFIDGDSQNFVYDPSYDGPTFDFSTPPPSGSGLPILGDFAEFSGSWLSYISANLLQLVSVFGLGVAVAFVVRWFHKKVNRIKA